MYGIEAIVGAPLAGALDRAGALDNVIAQNNREQGRDKPCPYRGTDIKTIAASMALIYNKQCCACSISRTSP